MKRKNLTRLMVVIALGVTGLVFSMTRTLDVQAADDPGSFKLDVNVTAVADSSRGAPGSTWSARALGTAEGGQVSIEITGIRGVDGGRNGGLTDLVIRRVNPTGIQLGSLHCYAVGARSSSGWCEGGTGKYAGASGTFQSLHQNPSYFDEADSRKPVQENGPLNTPEANPADIEIQFNLGGVQQ